MSKLRWISATVAEAVVNKAVEYVSDAVDTYRQARANEARLAEIESEREALLAEITELRVKLSKARAKGGNNGTT